MDVSPLFHSNIAIVAVAYNRKDALLRLLDSLSNAVYDSNESVTLIISIDKSDTDIVELVADGYEWKHGEKIVDRHEQNLGLRNHMLSLGKWFDSFDAIIVLEDDIVVAPDYFSFAKQTVHKYSSDEMIAGISLYSFKLNYLNNLPFEPVYEGDDVYFMNCAMSWGEIWMKDQWIAFYKWYQNNLDFPNLSHLPARLCKMGKKSWLKYHTRYCIETGKYFAFPYCSLSTNFSDAGTHNDGSFSSLFQVPLSCRRGGLYYLPNIKNKVVCYNGFFENVRIPEFVGLKDGELCVDLNGTRDEKPEERYWLTTQVKDFKVIRTFANELRPIELNIQKNLRGTGIFLYDTSIKEKNRTKSNILLYRYYLGGVVPFLRKYGESKVLREYFDRYINRKRKK